MKFTVVPNGYFLETLSKIGFHRTEVCDREAEFALQIIEKHALLVADFDGEDSAGRQKVRKSTPEEIVSAACDIAAEAFRQIRARGWTTTLPDLAPVWEERLAKEAAKKSEREQV